MTKEALVCKCCFRTVDDLPNGIACRECLDDNAIPDPEADSDFDPYWDKPDDY